MRWNVRRADIPQDVRNKFEHFGEKLLAHALGGGQISEPWLPALGPLLRNEQYQTYLLAWLIERSDLAERRATITLVAAVAAAVIAFLAWMFPLP
jgi:hypothetical protein